MGREACHALGRAGCEAASVIVKIPVSTEFIAWLSKQVGWGAFNLFHRALTKATGGYESAELVRVLPDRWATWLVFRVEVPPPPVS